MSEEDANSNSGAGEVPEAGEAAAVAVALGTQGSLDPRAASFLEEQTRLARKQGMLADLRIEYVAELDRFELSHLRFRKMADYARFALEVSVALVALLIVIGIAAMVWSAARDHDLVVEAFSVPPDVAQSGMTGQALAARVLDRFGAMQSESGSLLLQGANTYRRDSGDTVRIEIPETGISLGELYKDLRGWLGHETHVTGDLVRTKSGLALTLRFGDKPGETETGSDLDALVQKASEYIYASAKPYRYIEYLATHGRSAEALALAPVVVQQSGDTQDRALGYLAWGDAAFLANDMETSLDKYHEAVRLDPSDPFAHAWLGITESTLQHKEAGDREMRAAVRNWRGPLVDQLDPNTRNSLPLFFTAAADDDSGDFPDSLAAWRKLVLFNSQENFTRYSASTAADDHDIALARALVATIPEKDAQGRPNPNPAFPKFYIAYASGDWASALRLGREAQAMVPSGRASVQQDTYLLPLLAYAQAETGDIAGAEKLIAGMPADNDRYMEMRGRIEAIDHHYDEAARDFAILSARSPNIPSADADWGAMLMQEGKFDAAIAKFAVAHGKSPRFADPLEMWGEALMAENRSDLALAKFKEAEQDAPNWGRLHLKWGEALWWLGRKNEARAQFAAAAALVLAPGEQVQLSQMESRAK